MIAERGEVNPCRDGESYTSYSSLSATSTLPLEVGLEQATLA